VTASFARQISVARNEKREFVTLKEVRVAHLEGGSTHASVRSVSGPLIRTMDVSRGCALTWSRINTRECTCKSRRPLSPIHNFLQLQMRLAKYREVEIRIGIHRNVPCAFLALARRRCAEAATLLPFRKIRRISRDMRATSAARNLQANCQFSDDSWSRPAKRYARRWHASGTWTPATWWLNLCAECTPSSEIPTSRTQDCLHAVSQTWISGLTKHALCVLHTAISKPGINSLTFGCSNRQVRKIKSLQLANTWALSVEALTHTTLYRLEGSPLIPSEILFHPAPPLSRL